MDTIEKIDVDKIMQSMIPPKEELEKIKIEWNNKHYACDMAYWFPILKQTGVLVPRTELFETNVELLKPYEGIHADGFDEFKTKLRECANKIGYPLFLRCGTVSGKHEGFCWVNKEEELIKQMFNILEFAAIVDCTYFTWAVRERLRLESGFTAFKDFPVNKERRYFFEDGKVICHHPYWIERSIENASVIGWKRILDKLNFESEEEIAYLTEQTLKVAQHFKGAWSLDWALSSTGKWYAIDMAWASQSFHYDGCPNERRRWETFQTDRPTFEGFIKDIK